MPLTSESISDKRFTGLLLSNLTEKDVWGYLTGVAEIRANAEVNLYNLS